MPRPRRSSPLRQEGRSPIGRILPAMMILAALGAEAAGADLRPGIIDEDDRTILEDQGPPWDAVGQVGIGGFRSSVQCTGTLIAPDLVVTAAHCVVSPATGKPFPLRDIHFLAGVRGPTNKGHATARVPALSLGPPAGTSTFQRQVVACGTCGRLGDHRAQRCARCRAGAARGCRRARAGPGAHPCRLSRRSAIPARGAQELYAPRRRFFLLAQRLRHAPGEFRRSGLRHGGRVLEDRGDPGGGRRRRREHRAAPCGLAGTGERPRAVLRRRRPPGPGGRGGCDGPPRCRRPRCRYRRCRPGRPSR
jgi:hypothetical protein